MTIHDRLADGGRPAVRSPEIDIPTNRVPHVGLTSYGARSDAGI